MNILGRSDISRSREWSDYDSCSQEEDYYYLLGKETSSQQKNNCFSGLTETRQPIYSRKKDDSGNFNTFPKHLEELSEKIDEIFSEKIIPEYSFKRIRFFDEIYKVKSVPRSLVELGGGSEELSELDKLYLWQSYRLSEIRCYLKFKLISESVSIGYFLEIIAQCEKHRKKL
ncbi:MAG: hypothetical protein H0W50_01590 [Parachlamydiaceae bacterium]|nr:hypothetical protein [Parachlamydiaceae bacterium]